MYLLLMFSNFFIKLVKSMFVNFFKTPGSGFLQLFLSFYFLNFNFYI